MREHLAKHIGIYAWGLGVLVALLAITAWGQGLRWHFSNMSTYKLFPVFGLLAFSLMWSVYAVSFTTRKFDITTGSLRKYYLVLPLIIFGLIILHPGLLWWQLWRDGFGLPPQSYLQNYVAPSLRWAALIGTTALVVFIAYEFRYKYRQKSWWKYMEILADIVLVGLFFHALALGGQLQHGWFRYLWYFYGLALAIFLFDLYKTKMQKKVAKSGQ